MGKVLVIGLGVSGRAAAKLLLNKGEQVVVADKRSRELQHDPEILPLLKRGVVLVDDSVQSLQGFSYVVASPGVPQGHALYLAALQSGIELIGEIELACRYALGRMVGITGTNGKTTVTLLIEHVLNAVGKKALALGNVGLPLTAKIGELQTDTIAVLELSSFQLETLQQKVLDCALLLNITPDHLDRYADMEEYARAKIQIGACLKNGDAFFVEEKTYGDFRTLFEDKPCQLYGYDPTSTFHTDLQRVFFRGRSEFALDTHVRKKSHDLENILAAYAVCHFFGVPADLFLAATRTFVKPKHRIQFVREIGGVCYYDDSKGTNIDAVKRAVQALPGQIILIAGGVDKGAPYTSWIEAFAGKVRCILAIGEAKEKLKTELGSAIDVFLEDDLKSAVLHARNLAQPQENVLLSPGCSSFDMFRDYAHRGDEFQSLVNSL